MNQYCTDLSLSYKPVSFTPKLRNPWTLKIFLECSLSFDQSGVRPCNHRKQVGFSVTVQIWFSIFLKRPSFDLNLPEFKLLFPSIWEPQALWERKMCEWFLVCCGCIVATAADCRYCCSLLGSTRKYPYHTTDGLSEFRGQGGVLWTWNLKAWGDTYDWNSEGMGEFLDLWFPQETDKSVFLEKANFMDF